MVPRERGARRQAAIGDVSGERPCDCQCDPRPFVGQEWFAGKERQLSDIVSRLRVGDNGRNSAGGGPGVVGLPTPGGGSRARP